MQYIKLTYWEKHFVCYFCGKIFLMKDMSDNDLVCKYCREDGFYQKW